MASPSHQFDPKRFWAKVDKSGTCWVWTGALLNGYGRFGATLEGRKRSALAHRLAYEMTGQDIPKGMFLDHVCHNRACVNPAHLRVVNNKQNGENHNGPTKRNTSGARGVSLFKPTGRWRVQVTHAGKLYCGGYFRTLAEAEHAAVALRCKLHTHNDLDRGVQQNSVLT